MKEFDLQKAIAGEPLITRYGRKVEQFFYFDKAENSDYKIAAVVEGFLYTYQKNGNYETTNEESTLDLFMAPKTRKIYFALIKLENDLITSSVYIDEEFMSKDYPPTAEIIEIFEREIEE